MQLMTLRYRSYDELFRLIRAAGPSNPAKARAVNNVLTGVRVLVKKLYEQVHSQNLTEQTSSLGGTDLDVTEPSLRPNLVEIVGHLLAKAPQWLRQDLNSANPAVRLRAEDTLAAMIAASLANEFAPSRGNRASK